MQRAAVVLSFLVFLPGLVSAQSAPDLSGLPKAVEARRDTVCQRQRRERLLCEIKYSEAVELAKGFLAAHEKAEKLRGTPDRESFQEAFDEAKNLLIEFDTKRKLLESTYR